MSNFKVERIKAKVDWREKRQIQKQSWFASDSEAWKVQQIVKPLWREIEKYWNSKETQDKEVEGPK